MTIQIEKKRNIALIGHRGAGKTTLAEGMLFIAGATARPGRVDDGTSILDCDPEGQRRRITVSTAVHHYDRHGHRVTMLDTPGHGAFLTETHAALDVADGAVILLSAISGIKAQTEQVWAFADEYELCRVAFVNKMDKENATGDGVVRGMEEAFGVRALVTQIPIGEGESFRGVVDLLTMKAHLYKRDASTAHEVSAIPEGLKMDAQAMRGAMVELIAEVDDALTEKFLGDEEISVAELARGIREGVRSHAFVPVIYGSAYHNMGTDLLMDFIENYLPSPNELAPVIGARHGSHEQVSRERAQVAPFSAFVFKTMVDQFTGKLSIMRVYSGRIAADSPLFNSTRNAHERGGHMYLVEGRRATETKEAMAGDIVAVARLKETRTGDTLSDEADPIVFPMIAPARACISYAVAARSRADDDKVPHGLHLLMEEDPSLVFARDERTNEFILSGAGQVHVEVSVEKLKRKYACDVELKSPRIPYRETIRATVSVQGRYKKQSGGHGQFGDAWMEFSPLPRGRGFEFENAIVGGAIPKNYIPAVERGVAEAMAHGFVAGYPMVDISCRLYDGSYHAVDSSEMAFKVAASMGFKKAMETAMPILLEPIVSMEITVPEDSMGAVMGDMNGRRGRVLGMEARRASQVIRVQVPMAEVVNYANALGGMTHDRGSFTMDFSHYEEAPPNVAERLIKEATART